MCRHAARTIDSGKEAEHGFLQQSPSAFGFGELATPASRDVPIGIRLERDRLFRWHIAIIAALLLAGSIVTFIAIGYDTPYQLGLRPLLDLDGEQNIPATFSAVALLAASLLLAVIRADERQRAAPLRHYWLALSLGFVFLALDESASIHEKLNGPIRKLFDSPGFEAAWVVAGLVGALVVGALFVPFLLRIRRRTAVAFVVAGAVFCSGALAAELVGGGQLVGDERMTMVFQSWVIVEEGMEMLGVALFIRAVLREIELRRLKVRFSVT